MPAAHHQNVPRFVISSVSNCSTSALPALGACSNARLACSLALFSSAVVGLLRSMARQHSRLEAGKLAGGVTLDSSGTSWIA